MEDAICRIAVKVGRVMLGDNNGVARASDIVQ